MHVRITILGVSTVRLSCLAPRALAYSAVLACAPLFGQTTAVGTTAGQFEVDAMGAATYTVPITVPPGIGGIAPQLAIEYSSQSGNGTLGIGFALSGLSQISRCNATLDQDGYVGGVDFTSDDRFCLDGQRLVAVSGTYGEVGTEYRTEIESFSKIISYGGTSGDPTFFRV